VTRPVGPPVERVPSSDRVNFAEFARVVGVLTDGAALFPRPFDLLSSALLGNNTQTTDADEALRETCRQFSHRYRIAVQEVVDSPAGTFQREVVDCVIGPVAAMALLWAIADQLNQSEGEL